MANQKKKKSHVPARLNLLFFAVFLLFSALILRLGFVQIVNGEEFVKQLDRTTNVTARIDAPRGLMYDRYGNVVVDNELELSLTYTSPTTRPSEAEKLDVARKLETMIDIDTSKITERDMKDFWIINNREEALEKVSTEERRELDNQQEYQLTLDRITEAELSAIENDEVEMRVLAIKREMDRGFALAPQRIKQGIRLEEAHIVSENLSELPGIDILRDSSRKFVFGDTFKSIFGRTGSIPRESLDFYLSRGYDRSDIVGTSFLENQYEEALRGQKAVVENITSRGSVVGSPIEQLGQRGNDLVLTIDMELQQQVEEIINREVDGARRSYIDDPTAYVVLMNPKTGEILSMAGYNNDHTGVINKAYAMGSAIKGATVLAGFQEGVVQPGTVIHDSPINLPGSPQFKSVANMGSINDITALERSSNVYMAHIVMRSAGYNYGQQGRIYLNQFTQALHDMRNYFSQFGLGTETGIDLPSESTGIVGPLRDAGNLLHFSIGQFDTYTTLQLAQYVATIANDGYRMQPHLVKEIREPGQSKDELGRVIYQNQPRVMNRVDMSDEHIQRVQYGFRQVMAGSRGTGTGTFGNRPYQPAGKTGTSQVKVSVPYGERTRLVEGNNQTLVGYAPYNDPEVAFAVVIPHVKRDREGGDTQISRRIARAALDTYFELQQSRSGPVLGEAVENDMDMEQPEEESVSEE
ncbi:peptidoglycan D,D-transpeptidase FtsI family protein [Bacillus sp. FJAT-45350]|uniref:peptidoglycan D,D-transpeptidase FtsI family protein n=1 Tax=Bacillus sp. FJAT-45350 TaxID=2011014 RepID=UPI000BB7CF6B|nr:penicillin-binding protein 2 [Bacillus sp. FJAT-45350]